MGGPKKDGEIKLYHVLGNLRFREVNGNSASTNDTYRVHRRRKAEGEDRELKRYAILFPSSYLFEYANYLDLKKIFDRSQRASNLYAKPLPYTRIALT